MSTAKVTPSDLPEKLAHAIGYENSGTINNYMDWGVIGPIAAKYKLFPTWNTGYKVWTISMEKGLRVISDDCPQTCIALAVVEAKENGLLDKGVNHEY